LLLLTSQQNWAASPDSYDDDVKYAVVTRNGTVVGVFVAVAVGVGVGVRVGVAVGVLVGVFVAVFVGVLVGVRVPVGVAVGVFVRVAVPVGVRVPVSVGVGVNVGVGGFASEGLTLGLRCGEGDRVALACGLGLCVSSSVGSGSAEAVSEGPGSASASSSPLLKTTQNPEMSPTAAATAAMAPMPIQRLKPKPPPELPPVAPGPATLETMDSRTTDPPQDSQKRRPGVTGAPHQGQAGPPPEYVPGPPRVTIVCCSGWTMRVWPPAVALGSPPRPGATVAPGSAAVPQSGQKSSCPARFRPQFVQRIDPPPERHATPGVL
jgi:hypothetical protein